MTSKAKSGRWAAWWLLALLVFAALLGGMLLAADMGILVAIMLFAGLAGTLLFVGIFGVEDKSGWLLACGWNLMLVSHVAHTNGVPVGYLLELVAFAFAVSSARMMWRLARTDRTLKLVIVLFLLYLGVAILSSLLGRSQRMAAAWQLQYNLKLPLMFALGTLIVYTDQVERVLRVLLAWSWLFILPFLVLELAAPNLYSQLCGAYLDVHMNPLLGIGGRMKGPFSHSGYLALFAGLLAAGAAIQLMQGHGRRWGLLALVYCAMVVATGQRQEAFALLLVGTLFFWMQRRRNLLALGMAAIVVGGLAVFVLLYLEQNPLQDLFDQWSGARASQLSERAILTEKGLQIAGQYFPLGSGLGTYGGAGAQKFDLSQFYDLGFARYWWFRQGLFIVDTYWPSVVAESGYFGAALLLATFLLAWAALVRRAVRRGAASGGLVLLGLAAMTLLLANSPSSAVIGDPRGAFVLWLLIGCAWRNTVAVPAPAAARAGRGAPSSVRQLPDYPGPAPAAGKG